MKDWVTIPFGDLYSEPSRNGLMRPKRVRGSGFKMVNMGEIFAYDRINDPPMELVPLNDRELETYTLQKGDLLFARQSMVESGAGKCVIVLNVPEVTTFESHLIRVRLDDGKCLPNFYYYYFQSPVGRGKIQSIVTGAAQKGIRGSDLQRLDVDFPDLRIQERIAEILSAYDDLIDNNNRRIALLEEAIHRLYREWFVHLRFPGHEHTPVVAGVPEGWEKRPLAHKEVTTFINRGYQPKYQEDSDCRVINQRCIRDRKIDFELTRGNNVDLRPVNDEKRFVRFGDVLVNSTGVGTLGRLAQVYEELQKNMVDSHVTIVRPSEKVNVDYFGIMMWGMEHIIERLGEGATNQTELSRQRLGKLEIMVPPIELQRDFSRIAQPMRKQITALRNQNKLLAEARDSLLPRLMNGSLPV